MCRLSRVPRTYLATIGTDASSVNVLCSTQNRVGIPKSCTKPKCQISRFQKPNRHCKIAIITSFSKQTYQILLLYPANSITRTTRPRLRRNSDFFRHIDIRCTIPSILWETLGFCCSWYCRWWVGIWFFSFGYFLCFLFLINSSELIVRFKWNLIGINCSVVLDWFFYANVGSPYCSNNCHFRVFWYSELANNVDRDLLFVRLFENSKFAGRRKFHAPYLSES